MVAILVSPAARRGGPQTPPAPAPAGPAVVPLRLVAAPPAGARVPAVYVRRRLAALALLFVMMATTIGATLGVVSAVGARLGALTPSSAGAPAANSHQRRDGLPASDSDYVVRRGDTLWSIARDLEPDGDIRPVVDALADRAGGPLLQPGQRIDLDGLG